MRDTTIILYRNVGLSLNRTDTFDFDSVNQQNDFFASKVLTTFVTNSYQRDNRSYIRVNSPKASLANCDYLSFINQSYENRKYYCFVTAVNYINDNTTELEFVIDVMQTFLFAHHIAPCFVERMHTPTDNIGDNLLLDSFDLGEYVNGGYQPNLIDNRDLCIMIESSFDAFQWVTSGYQTKVSPNLKQREGNLYGNTSVVCIPVAMDGEHADNDSMLADFFTHLWQGSGGVTTQDILSMWIYPFNKLALRYYDSHGRYQSRFDEMNFIYDVGGFRNGLISEGAQVAVNGRPSQLDGYTPKNKKLLTYPFCQLLITNNNGSATSYKYEYFTDPTNVKFATFFTTTAEAKTRLSPINYKGITGEQTNFDEAIDSAPFPLVSFVGDSYNIWLAQNRNTIQNNFDNMLIDFAQAQANSFIGGASSAMQGNYGGAVQSGLNMANAQIDATQQLNSMLAQIEDTKVRPNTASGIQANGITFQSGYNNFSAIRKTIDASHAKMIDDYYTAFGYPVREIKPITRKTRQAFTYIKTVGAHCTSNIPQEYKTQIEAIYNSGVRFWTNKTNFGDLTISNPTL